MVYQFYIELHESNPEGHIFYSAACSADLMVYDNKRVTLPEKPDMDISAIKVHARNIFDDAFLNAKSFLEVLNISRPLTNINQRLFYYIKQQNMHFVHYWFP
ncbi:MULTISPECIES: hypothetical protein [Niastella]|uniref:Uncharacterized protein n=1 Tax=Niastella soli TaxID=2821487 RepID=A0ABS3YVT1_9BACT|nr:hypothetical protein [Niastella soli]MBO9202041.1 hypothetical protein [Niastella soli]